MGCFFLGGRGQSISSLRDGLLRLFFFVLQKKICHTFAGSPIEDVKYQPIVLKETIMGDQD